MSTKRKSFSVRPAIYDLVATYCEDRMSLSDFIEQRIADFFQTVADVVAPTKFKIHDPGPRNFGTLGRKPKHSAEKASRTSPKPGKDAPATTRKPTPATFAKRPRGAF